jgi:Family of unknown function (DUF5654)
MEQITDVASTFKENFLKFVVGALSFIVSLGWNEAFKSVIAKYYPLKKNSVMAKIIYAFIMTCFLVFILYLLG